MLTSAWTCKKLFSLPCPHSANCSFISILTATTHPYYLLTGTVQEEASNSWLGTLGVCQHPVKGRGEVV